MLVLASEDGKGELHSAIVNTGTTDDTLVSIESAPADAPVQDGSVPQDAADKVTVGVFPISSSLPYFVAIEKGYFKEANIWRV